MITGRAPAERPALMRREKCHESGSRLHRAGLDKGEVVNIQRRLFLRTGLTLGAATLLSGCDVITNTAPVDGFLRMISSFNDGVQAALFSPNRLAPTFPEQHGRGRCSATTRSTAPERDPRDQSGRRWRLEVVRARLRQDAVDARPAQIAAAARRRDAPRVRRRLEHDRQMGRRAAARVPGKSRRGHVAPNMWRSAATIRSATTPRSTWRRRCIRRPSCASPTRTSRSSRSSARRCGSRSRPSSASSSRNSSPSIHVTNEYPGGYWERYGYNWFAGL